MFVFLQGCEIERVITTAMTIIMIFLYKNRFSGEIYQGCNGNLMIKLTVLQMRAFLVTQTVAGWPYRSLEEDCRTSLRLTKNPFERPQAP